METFVALVIVALFVGGVVLYSRKKKADREAYQRSLPDQPVRHRRGSGSGERRTREK